MTSRLKHLLLSLLPRPVRRQLRRYHSPRLVLGFTEDRWPEAPVVKQMAQPGSCCIDCGANIGYVTKLLASWVGPQGIVHSIEPVPDTYELLARAVQALHLTQVRTHPCAVSSEDGEGTMEVPRYAGGTENYYESHVVGPGEQPAGGGAVRVSLRRLDTLLAGAEDRVAFIKMDVEGHELKAFQGASAILARSRPALFVEIDGDPDAVGSAAAATFHHLGERGYRPYTWREGRLWARSTGERAVDYFFLMDHHQAQLSPWLAAAGGP